MDPVALAASGGLAQAVGPALVAGRVASAVGPALVVGPVPVDRAAVSQRPNVR
jgi:hypothetical protein